MPPFRRTGKLFAYTTNDWGQRSLWLGSVNGGNHLQLRPAADAVYYDLAFSPDQVVKQFDLPKTGTLSMGSRWTPDSHAVVYRDNNFGYWKQSIKGGEAKRLEGLPKEKFYNFAFSKDGKWVAFVRGQEIRDVIMISNSK